MLSYLLIFPELQGRPLSVDPVSSVNILINVSYKVAENGRY